VDRRKRSQSRGRARKGETTSRGRAQSSPIPRLCCRLLRVVHLGYFRRPPWGQIALVAVSSFSGSLYWALSCTVHESRGVGDTRNPSEKS